MNQRKKKGFTMIELLLVSAYTAIMFTLFIAALNPSKHLSENRNAQRKNDINMLMSGIYQWSIDHGGKIPENITINETEICLNVEPCKNLIDLSFLTQQYKYLIKLPQDPTKKNNNGIGYTIKQEESGRISINAPHAERGEIINILQ